MKPRSRWLFLGLAALPLVACHSKEQPGPPKPARCTDTAACQAAQYCDYQPGLCGKGKELGTCTAARADCGAGSAPVCGCDHRVYPSECAAQAAGVDLDVNGGCQQLLPSLAACGAHFCDTRRSYCEIVLSDVTELPSDYACKPFPASCVVVAEQAPDCACFPAGTRCLSFCGPIQTGGGTKGVHLTCRL